VEVQNNISKNVLILQNKALKWVLRYHIYLSSHRGLSQKVILQITV